jgi:uncharacterized protein (DUF2252 family)
LGVKEKQVATPALTGSADTAPANGPKSAGTTRASVTAPADRTKNAPAVPAQGVHATPQERAARGKVARAEVPRADHAVWVAPADRPDPIALLEAQAVTRVPELVPIRYGRMLTSPFTFYRGAAAIMAADLARTPSTGLHVQLCGDAHLANFGAFASPERDLVFNINDFDETLPGPWEWDVKRLASSFEICARDRGFGTKDRRAAVVAAVASYRQAMREFAAMRNLDLWYTQLNMAGMLNRWGAQASQKDLQALQARAAKAHTRDTMGAFAKLTHRVNGHVKIVSAPPLIVPIEELMPDEAQDKLEETMHHYLHAYRRSLISDRRHLLEDYRLVHLARKVVGVGSVGTRAWIMLLLGRDDDDPLFLQIKEVQASVLEPYAGKSRFTSHGQRVVEGQRLTQAASDIMLGWERLEGLDGITRDFYTRQLWDWKISADLETITPGRLVMYAEMCGWTLARAHARSGDRIALAAYLGGSDAFDQAIAEFAVAYAQQNERDYQALGEAVKSGRITAKTGV